MSEVFTPKTLPFNNIYGHWSCVITITWLYERILLRLKFIIQILLYVEFTVDLCVARLQNKSNSQLKRKRNYSNMPFELHNCIVYVTYNKLVCSLNLIWLMNTPHLHGNVTQTLASRISNVAMLRIVNVLNKMLFYN